LIISTCPKVIGSNVPGNKQMRINQFLKTNNYRE
jgi:hypothetical protein